MTPAQFARYVARDGSDYTMGDTGDQLVPQHRQGRGAGGSKLRDVPSNIITFNSIKNGLIESHAADAAQARYFGWKLASWENPLESPCFHSVRGWVMLDDNFGIRAATDMEVIVWLAAR